LRFIPDLRSRDTNRADASGKPLSARRPERHELIAGVRESFESARLSEVGYLRPFKRNLVDVFVSKPALAYALDAANELFRGTREGRSKVYRLERRQPSDVPPRLTGHYCDRRNIAWRRIRHGPGTSGEEERVFNSDLKRGSMELLILSTLERRALHGYDIGKMLDERSGGQMQLPVSTLYSTLYRMEDRGWIKGRWVEKAGERRRCFYTLTADGRQALAAQRREWEAFAAVVDRVLGGSHA
jgi:transcriptional regulator